MANLAYTGMVRPFERASLNDMEIFNEGGILTFAALFTT